ncbi:hypothetical protein ANCDUO_26851 [Ancylostoma duodenale]|uniref:PH domain-containing protein n=1 Tax=Ancylostoma duodenale TaxID=51022 RepID=A0A0C2F3N5_9BILA|nr:hypothetical protein ANCDUO_26851 [Ancylostoma duodenale]
MQSTSIENECGVVSQSAAPFLTLARCWQCLPARITKDRAFVTLVTSAFPTVKEQDKLYKELEEASFFDCFSLDGPSNRWSCFSCSHPDRVKSFVEDGSQRVLEGQLKEKKGRWRFLRRWHTKYFTLSSAALTCSSEQTVCIYLLHCDFINRTESWLSKVFFLVGLNCIGCFVSHDLLKCEHFSDNQPVSAGL